MCIDGDVPIDAHMTTQVALVTGGESKSDLCRSGERGGRGSSPDTRYYPLTFPVPRTHIHTTTIHPPILPTLPPSFFPSTPSPGAATALNSYSRQCSRHFRATADNAVATSELLPTRLSPPEEGAGRQRDRGREKDGG
jgi:hypothetical protein